LSLSFDISLSRRWPFAFLVQALAGTNDERMQRQRDDDIEIHCAYASDFPALLREEDILDEQDWADISRQRNRDLRRRAIAIRVLLRNSLGRLFEYKVEAPRWRFARTSYGRLVLADGQPQAYFSISHTRGASVIALSKVRPVGIDIEALDSETDTDALVTGLSRREQITVGRLDPQARSKALLKLWTLKEAYTKLIGVGLAADLPSYEFRMAPSRDGCYCGSEDHARETHFETWFIKNHQSTFCVALAGAATAFY